MVVVGTTRNRGRNPCFFVVDETQAEIFGLRDCFCKQYLGNDGLEELIGLLTPWGKAIRDSGGYPAQGPHELAALSARA